MNDRYFQAARQADILSLGSHWVYDQGQLADIYPEGISEPIDPQSEYHPNRKAGQLTHFGDQMVLLKAALVPGTYDHQRWRDLWLAGMSDYDGYLDGATKTTLENKGLKPSSSSDLSGASRLAPILDLDLPASEKIAAARSQTGLTHGDPAVSDAAEFFVRATLAIEGGASISNALDQAATEGDYTALPVLSHLATARAAGDDFRAVGKTLGLTCNIKQAFPLTLYFALRPDATLASTISENGLAGGDTSARSMLFALLFAARE